MWKARQPAAFRRRRGCVAAHPTKSFECFVGFVIKKKYDEKYYLYENGRLRQDLVDCLSYKTADSVFVFEGIHHNRAMEDAWEEIKADEDVSVTFDLYCIGMVFFREGIEKQDFVLKY